MKKWLRKIQFQEDKAAKYGSKQVLSYSAQEEMIGDIKLLFYDCTSVLKSGRTIKECMVLMSSLSLSTSKLSKNPIDSSFFYSIKRIWSLPTTFRTHSLAHDCFVCHLAYHSSLLTGPFAPAHSAARMVLSKWNQVISLTCSNTSLLGINTKSFPNGS